jgi:hypothetical protein
MLTAGSVVALAREALIDTVEDACRWPDAVLYRFAFDARRQLNSVRPCTHYNGVTLIRYDYPDIRDGNDAKGLYGEYDLLLDERWRECLVAYVCYRALAIDSSDTANMNLAGAHLARFKELSQL